MGLFLSLLNSWLSNLRTKQTIRNIEKNNELRKNISRYQPSDIEAFIERDKQVGSYIISGINPSIRCRAAASVAACALSQNIPVIIIHEGNTLLQNHVIQATAFTKNKVVISNNTTIYDPFYNRSDQEICNLIINSAKSSGTINAVGQLYILGIIQFIKSKNIPPYCEMFIRCPHDSLFDKIDDAESNGYLKSNTATQIRDLLMQGQSERANVQSFLAQLAYQGIGVLSNKGNRNSVVNVKTAVSHNGLLMIDVGSSTNDILINVLINEVKELLACGNKMMLILDNIGLNSNDVLSKLLKSLSSRCLTTLVSEDIYSMLGGDEKLFHSFVGNACKSIVLSHASGISCTKWSEVFGYYDVDKVSHNMGGNTSYQWGYGYGNTNSISVSNSREFIVKPEEISHLQPNEVFILDRNLQELAHTIVR